MLVILSVKNSFIMKILIVCNTEESKATELSLYLKCEAERMNRRVVVLNAADVSRAPGNFDATVVVGEIHNKHFSESVCNYISCHLDQLNVTPSFFLSILSCEDENNLSVPEHMKQSVREFLQTAGWNPQQVMVLPAGTRLQDHEFVTLTDWPELKISLQRFLIRNDLIMAG